MGPVVSESSAHQQSDRTISITAARRAGKQETEEEREGGKGDILLCSKLPPSSPFIAPGPLAYGMVPTTL